MAASAFRPLQGIVQIDQVAGRMVNSGELSPAIGTPMSQSPGMTPLSGGGLTPLGQNFNATPEYNEFEAAIQKVPVLDRCPATNEFSCWMLIIIILFSPHLARTAAAPLAREQQGGGGSNVNHMIARERSEICRGEQR